MGSILGRWNEWSERARTSLFLLPLLAVVAAAGLGAGLLAIDSQLDDTRRVPLVFTSTVESARQVLSTVGAATISFAGIAFSVALLVIQRTSAQYSPRVVQTLFRDPFNRRVMALVVGTFTYCLVVLRTVRTPDAEGAEAVVPNLSISLALVLGIVSILAVVAFIDHSAKAMDVSQILERVSSDAAKQLDAAMSTPEDAIVDPTDTPTEQTRVDHVVRFVHRGWVQRLDLEQLRSQVPAGGTIVVHTAPGRYAVPGAPFCSVAGPVQDPDVLDRCLRDAVSLGSSRTLLQDPSYGLRQSVDIALRALSPGVNDPTTAQDAIFHSAAMLAGLLRSPEAPRALHSDNGGVLLLPELPRHEDLIDLAYDEVRRAAAPHPTVCIYLLESLRQTQLALRPGDRQPDGDRLTHQARLVLQGCESADLIEHDRLLVRRAFESRFTPEPPASASSNPAASKR